MLSGALTPPHSHGEREKTIKNATFVAFLLLPIAGWWPPPHPLTPGQGPNNKKTKNPFKNYINKNPKKKNTKTELSN
ncbi:hypothetical protein, partial [Enterobacter asburiae]